MPPRVDAMLARSQRGGKRKQAAPLLLDWYDRSRRRLPWRAEPGAKADPYAVWLSEIMLQQTTVQAVKPYYKRFLTLWPRVENLAAAPVEDVMKEWAGLGYYSRARNLHACAKTVAAELGGVFPCDEAGLRALPGIGPYTAAAIAAIAFGKRAVVVDGNVERVVSRLYSIEDAMPAAKPIIRTRAGEITPDDRAGDFAQAMMDLGATICTPRKPACAICPLTAMCSARASGEAERFPLRAAKTERPRRLGAVFYARRADGCVLVRTRPPKGLLGGMSEFPGSAWSADFDLKTAREHAPLSARWRKLAGTVEHVFTHFALSLAVFRADVPVDAIAPEGCRWRREDRLEQEEALPSLMQKVAVLARGE
jgi:A/G-specific adenine glycosylase